LLEVLRATEGVRFIHLTSSTVPELQFNVAQIPRYRSYGLLYLSFHGSKGAINLIDGSRVTAQDLADMMRGVLDGWFVHFAACSVVMATAELTEFMSTTGARLVTGYDRNVEWIEGAAMDLLVLDWAQYYKQPRSLVNRLKRTYPDLVAKTGFDAVFWS
jgi:hypothetical protein